MEVRGHGPVGHISILASAVSTAYTENCLLNCAPASNMRSRRWEPPNRKQHHCIKRLVSDPFINCDSCGVTTLFYAFVDRARRVRRKQRRAAWRWRRRRRRQEEFPLGVGQLLER